MSGDHNCHHCRRGVGSHHHDYHYYYDKVPDGCGVEHYGG